MKIAIKKPQFKRRKVKTDEPAVTANFAATSFSVGMQDVPGIGTPLSGDTFAVDVRNADATVKILDEESGNKWWKKILVPGLTAELGTGIALMSLFVLLLAASDNQMAIPFALAGVIVYLLLTYLGNILNEKVKYFAAAGIFVALVVLVVVFRKYIGGGLGITMNQVFSASEAEQAYVYKMYSIPETAETHPSMSVRLAVAWVSVLLAIVAAIPPAWMRRIIGVLAVCASMIAFAYYGLSPSAVCLVAMAIALVMLLAGGGMLSTLPVLLTSLLIFGAIMLIDPGENYGISRADENIRDRLALKSAYLETSEQMQMPDQNDILEENETEQDSETEFAAESGGIIWIIVTAVILLALAGAAFLIYRRYKNRRDKNRLGLDNPNPKTAITAMFPYGIKWLGAGDIDVSGKAFEKLIPMVEHSISPEYADKFKGMYELWQEAAYSDHPMDEEGRTSMQAFLDETIATVKGKFKFKDKIRNALKYAL